MYFESSVSDLRECRSALHQLKATQQPASDGGRQEGERRSQTIRSQEGAARRYSNQPYELDGLTRAVVFQWNAVALWTWGALKVHELAQI